MKTFFLSIAALFVGTTLLFGQNENTEAQENKLIDYGNYGSLEFKFTSYLSEKDYDEKEHNNYNSFHLLLGGRSVWEVSPDFGLGFAGYLSVSDLNQFISIPDKNESNYAFHTAYLGLFGEYAFFKKNNFMLMGNILIGTGAGILVLNTRSCDGSDEFEDFGKGPYFVIQPGLSADIFTSNSFAISGGLSYRLSVGSGFEHIKNKYFSNVSFNIALKFGDF